MNHKACHRMAPVLQARDMASRNLHTAPVIGSIPAAATPIAQFGVWNWPASPLEGVAVPESVSVWVPPGSPRLVAPGSRMISTDPGSREVDRRRDSTQTSERREPVRCMDFRRVSEIPGTSVVDYGSGGWGFEFLRACQKNPCTAGGFPIRGVRMCALRGAARWNPRCLSSTPRSAARGSSDLLGR